MKELFTRRNILIGAGGAAVAAGAGYEVSRLLRKHYAPSPYDDLLALLDEREAAARIGSAVELGDYDVKTAAAYLRVRLKDSTLSAAMAQDAADGRLVEAHGWVLPETLGLLCALAAKAKA
jgi:hypothetical protein